MLSSTRHYCTPLAATTFFFWEMFVVGVGGASGTGFPRRLLSGCVLLLTLLVLLHSRSGDALERTLSILEACRFTQETTGITSYAKLRVLDRFRSRDGLETLVLSARGPLDRRTVEQAAATWCAPSGVLPPRLDPQNEVLILQCKPDADAFEGTAPNEQLHLAAWTMLRLRPESQENRRPNNVERSVSQSLLLSWIIHHTRVGIRNFFIYLNEPDACGSRIMELRDELTERLADVPANVSIIAWPFRPPKGVHWNHVQIAAMNDCLWRNRGIFKWILFADVDEYIVPSENALRSNPESPVLHVLDDIERQLPINLCSVRVPCWWRYDVIEPALNWSEASQTSLRRPWLGAAAPVDRVCKPHLNREKCFVRTDQVYYTAVHAVAEAYGPNCVQVWPDVHQHLRLEHRRSPRAFDDYSPAEVLYAT
jgi:hypothetical protein